MVAILLSRCLFKGVHKTTDDKYLWQKVLKECWNRKHTWNSHPLVYNILSELSPSCSLKVQLFFMPAKIGLGKPKNNSENQQYKPRSPKAANRTGNACRGFKLALSYLISFCFLHLSIVFKHMTEANASFKTRIQQKTMESWKSSNSYEREV